MADSIINTYDGPFARAYDLFWSGYAREAGLRILEFFASHPSARQDARVMDLGCGSGQLMLLFLQAGWSVVGLDRSADMLELARRNTGPYTAEGRAVFLKADMRSFKVNASIALVTATYNVLNHLESEADLASCFRAVYDHLLKPGLFLFDLNTRKGLMAWDGLERQSTERIVYVGKGSFDEATGRATMRMEGSFMNPDGRGEAFVHTTVNHAFDLKRVEGLLKAAGFSKSHFALVSDLGTPIPEPEKTARVFVIAEKI
jgi:SAM-dependent methyltransferase